MSERAPKVVPNAARRHRVRRLGTTALAVVAASALTLVEAALPAAAADATWFVDQTVGTDGADCGESGGAGACQSIGAALAKATDTDTVLIAAGEYVENLTIGAGVTLQGASRNDVALTSTADNAPMIVVDTDGPVTIDSMTIRSEPDAATDGLEVVGGSSLTLNETTVSGFGGMAVVVGGDPSEWPDVVPATFSATDSTFADNRVGIALTAGTVTLTGGSVTGNSAEGLRGFTPAAEFDVTGTSITQNGNFNQNGQYTGGVVLQQGGTFVGNGVTISENYAGLLAEAGGNVTLNDSEVIDNLPNGDNGSTTGAGIFGQSGTDQVTGDPIPLDVTVDGGVVSGNRLGLNLTNARTLITESTISGNTVYGIGTTGDPLADPQSTLQLVDSLVTDNGSETNDGRYEPVGVIVGEAVRATIENTVIDDNQLGLEGRPGSTITLTGGSVSDNNTIGILAGTMIFSGGLPQPSSLEVIGTAINGNGQRADESRPFRTGLRIGGATVTATGVSLSGNGVGVDITDGSLLLRNSRVSGSGVQDPSPDEPSGNGISAWGLRAEVQVTLQNSEVSGNQANGLWLLPGSATRIVGSTVADNGDVGIRHQAGIDGPFPITGPAGLLLAGSTVAGNAGGGLVVDADLDGVWAGSIVQDCTGDGALTDGGFNLAGDDNCGLTTDSSVVGDLLLGPLADNGGPTNTMLPEAQSPALNLVPAGSSVGDGDAAVSLCGDFFDQRGPGYPRQLGSACDVGAVERAGGLITVTASDASSYVGGDVPQVTPSYAGLAGGDTLEVLDTLPTCSFDEAAGTTNCAGGADDFYTFEYVAGVFTVLPPLEWVTEALPAATVGEDYSVTLEATGGDGAPYTWGIQDGELPTGLTLDTATGVISGIPVVAGDVTFTLFVGDPIPRQFTLAVAPAPVPTTPTTPPPTTTAPTAPTGPTGPTTTAPAATAPTATVPTTTAPTVPVTTASIATSALPDPTTTTVSTTTTATRTAVSTTSDPVPAGGDQDLAATGADVGGVLSMALIVLALGFGLLLVGRRRGQHARQH